MNTLYSFLMGQLSNGQILTASKSNDGHQTMKVLRAHTSSRQKASKAERMPSVFPDPRDECSPSVLVVSRSMCVGTLGRGDESLQVDRLNHTEPMRRAILYPPHAETDRTKCKKTNIFHAWLPTDWERIDNLSISGKEELTQTNAKPPSFEELRQKFPKATAAECRRFRQANPKDAANKLDDYLAWREKYKLDVEPQSFEDEDEIGSNSKDLHDWKLAVQKVKSLMEGGISHSDGEGQTKSLMEYSTLRHVDKKKRTFNRSRKKEKTRPGDKIDAIPQLIVGPVVEETNDTIRDLTGHRVFCHLPARIDLRATSCEAYAEVLLLYIDAKQNRNNNEEFTLLVDVRGGPKWKNPPAISMLGFIRQVTHRVHDLVPGRLHCCIIYPVPYAAVCIWRLALHFLNAQIRDLLVVIPGCASSSRSPTPTKALEKYLSKESLVCLEKARQQALLE